MPKKLGLSGSWLLSFRSKHFSRSRRTSSSSWHHYLVSTGRYQVRSANIHERFASRIEAIKNILFRFFLRHSTLMQQHELDHVGQFVKLEGQILYRDYQINELSQKTDDYEDELAELNIEISRLKKRVQEPDKEIEGKVNDCGKP